MISTTLDKIRKNRILKLLVPLVFWLAVWQLAAIGVGKELLLPAPLAVFNRLLELGATGEFWLSSLHSLWRIFIGAAAGVAVGTLCAVLTSRFTLADWLLSPIIRIIRATPVASFIILVILWVTRTDIPGFISALMVLPVMWSNVSKGIRETDGKLLEMAAAYRFGRMKTIRLVYFNSVLPYFSSAVTTSLGLAWKAGIAAEVLCQPKNSIGTGLYNSKLYLETPSLFAWTAVIIILSYLLEKLVKLLLEIRRNRYADKS